uniref:Uncharacterized protein n=1 Tax=Latimeria chalumnae TaxID=7897 RepID=H3AIX4_LATCH
TSLKRISLFHGIVATQKFYSLYFSGINPQKLRLMKLNANPSEVVLLGIFYPQKVHLNVFVYGTFVPPTNAIFEPNSTAFILKTPVYYGQYMPTMDSAAGVNYFDQQHQTLYVVLRGSAPVEIFMVQGILTSFASPEVSSPEAWASIVLPNLAGYLSILPDQIQVTRIARDDQCSTSTVETVELSITEQPSLRLKEHSNATEMIDTITAKLAQAVLHGNISDILGINLTDVSIVKALPPPGTEEWAELSTRGVIQSGSWKHLAELGTIMVVQSPERAALPQQVFKNQPVIKAVSKQNECVAVDLTSWKVEAVLRDSNDKLVSGLNGTKAIPFTDCWANYTDLFITKKGTGYKLEFVLTSGGRQMKARSSVIDTDSNTSTAATGNSFHSNIIAAVACTFAVVAFLLIAVTAGLALKEIRS